MSCFLHDVAHIDVCVDAVLVTRYARDAETGLYANEVDPTELGRRFLVANLESVIARYGPPVAPGSVREQMDLGGDHEPWNYRHRRNQAVAALWAPRRLGSYHRAITSLRYQCCEVTDWPSLPIAQLLEDVLADLASQMADLFAVPDSWAWGMFDRGSLPHPRVPRAGAQEWTSLPIEVVTTAPGEDPLVFVNGEPVTASVLTVDAGAGWDWPQWCAFRDAALAAASPTARAVLLAAFADPIGGEFVTGRGQAHWLDPAPAPVHPRVDVAVEAAG